MSRLTRTLLHAGISTGVLLFLNGLWLYTKSTIGVGPAIAYAMTTLSAYWCIPAGLGFSIGLNANKGMALPVYLLLLMLSPGMSDAGSIAAIYGVTLLLGYAARGMVTEDTPPPKPEGEAS